MSILTYVTEVSLETVLALNPATQLIQTGTVLATGYTPVELAIQQVPLATQKVLTFAEILTQIWHFILNNFLTPLFVLLFIVLLIVAQYYFIKFVIWAFKNVISRGLKLSNLVIQSKQFQKLHEKFDYVFNEENKSL